MSCVEIKRTPSLCSWCKWGNTIEKDEIAPVEAETWCTNGHFENDKPRKGANNWPDKTECEDYNVCPTVTAVDVAWWPIAWSASERNRLSMIATIIY